MVHIQDVTAVNLDRARASLEAHLDTSIFLRYCLERFGPRLGEHRDSGNFRCLEEDGRIVAVATSTSRGLLVQTGRRADLGAKILRAYDGDPVRIPGIIAEWSAAMSVWPLLCMREGFEPKYEARQIVYRCRPARPRRRSSG